MRQLFTIIFLASILFSSCAKEPTTEEKVKTAIESKLLQSLHDPESYEFVSIGKIDTIYSKVHYGEMLEQYKELVNSMNNYPEKIEKFMEQAKEFRNYGNQYEPDAVKSEEMAQKLQKTYDESKEGVEKYQNLYDSSKENEIKELTTIFKCRANNKLGAKILTDYNVTLTDSLTVKDIQAIE